MTWILALLLATGAMAQNDAQNGEEEPAYNYGNRARLPMRVGDVNLIRGNLTHRSGVVLDDQGTAYILSVLANGENNLLRISRKGMVKELIMYRGWPYILDKRGRLWAFDVSWRTSFRNKVPYIAFRSLKTAPISLLAGVGVYGLALLDETFTGLMPADNFEPSSGFWAGVIGYYGFDLAHTLFLKSHRSINRGGDFFRELIAKAVQEISPDTSYDDYVITSSLGRGRLQHRYLSHLAPTYAGTSSCLEYLTKMNMR